MKKSHAPDIRRRANRIFVTFPVTMRGKSDGARFVEGTTVDFSSSGLRVRMYLPFQVRQKIEVKISAGEQPKTYTVVWVQDPSDDQPTYKAGLQIER